MKLLLVTGAGSSRRLGREGSSMPLMTDWSDALCAALDENESKLAQACHLRPGMDGEEFEQNLGLLLRWGQFRNLEERFQDLGGAQAGSHTNHAVKARENMNRRMEVVMRTINNTLYEQFGLRRIDDANAEAAYRSLLDEFDEPDLVVATTNYDRATEVALDAIGHDVDTGFRAARERTPTLEPRGLVAEQGSNTPVLHLHGAVGWYEREGTVEDHYGDQAYNPSLGTPVVLYPDPDKDPTGDAMVSELWAEFGQALLDADAVLVVGHSLHDRALVRNLNEIAERKEVAITFLDGEQAERVKTLVPRASPIQMDFGPEIDVDRRDLARLARNS